MDGKTIYERIESILISRNIKRKSLAEYVGVSNQVFTDMKNKGSIPSVDKVVKIADFLEVNIRWLVTGENLENSKQLSTLLHIAKTLGEENIQELIDIAKIKQQRILEKKLDVHDNCK